MQSTDVDRSLKSAEANINGIFPTARKNRNISIIKVPFKDEHLLFTSKKCNRFNLAVAEFQRSDDYLKFIDRNLYEYLGKNSGENITTPLDVSHLYDTLLVESINNFT